MEQIMDYYLDEGAVEPTRAHTQDAGMDLYAREEKRIPRGGSAVFDTGVHMLVPHNRYGKVTGRSSLNIKHGIVTMGEGTIDEGYTGSIKVKLYNVGEGDYIVCSGDKIAQLIIMKCEKPELRQVRRLPQTERGANGFGSTGK